MSHHEHHHHSHHEEPAKELSFAQKLETLLEHWRKHNEEHARTYHQWAEKAGEQSLGEVAASLQEAADRTVSLNRLFDSALQQLKNR
jgi:hypothetical protein